jgi:hypothetical protein
VEFAFKVKKQNFFVDFVKRDREGRGRVKNVVAISFGFLEFADDFENTELHFAPVFAAKIKLKKIGGVEEVERKIFNFLENRPKTVFTQFFNFFFNEREKFAFVLLLLKLILVSFEVSD